MTRTSAPSSADRPKARKNKSKQATSARGSKEAAAIRRLAKAQLTQEERAAVAGASLDRCLLWAAELAETRSASGSFVALDLAAKWCALINSLGGGARGAVTALEVPGFAPQTGGPRETGPTDAA